MTSRAELPGCRIEAVATARRDDDLRAAGHGETRDRTPDDDWTSLAVVSHGEYEIPEGLQFGFPVRSDGRGWEVVEGISLDEKARQKIKVTTEELEGERAEVQHLLPV